jgi:tetratricopeptide (TPR) repeat protein
MSADTAPARLSYVRSHYEQAVRALKAGDPEEAEKICRRALPKSGEDPNILCLLGEISLRLKRPQEGRTFYARVLKTRADYPRALEGMGLALLADGKPKKAVDYLQKAVEAVPERSATRFALGRALAESGHRAESEDALREGLRRNPRKAALIEAEKAQLSGRLEEAEKILREQLAQDPDDAKALRMLGNIALEANRFKAALRLLERAIELEPDFALAWNDVANLHMRMDRYDEALETIRKVIEREPDNVQSRVMLGNIFSRAQRHEEALDAYREALEIAPASAGALSGMGHVLKTIGRQAESIEAYRQCIAAHPGFGEAYWSLANLKTFEFDESEVETMKRMADKKALGDEARVNFFVSLGKHFENREDYERAFDYYRRGNDLRREHEIYDPVQTQVVHDRIIEVFGRDFLAERSGWGDPDPAPILIVGLPRSGSTLIEQILASHSMVEGTMELPDLSRIIGEINKRTRGRAEYPEAVKHLNEEGASALGKRYLETTMRYRSGKPHFIDKMPNNFPSIGLLQLILPNARVINARRHPLDSCLGSYKQLFFKGQSFTYDQFELGHYYLQYQRMMDHWHEVLPGKVLDVRYEDVVADLETQVRRILEHCGLPWEDRCLRYWETERAINTASSEQVRQPIYTGAVNFWRNYEAHLGELIQTLEPLLAELPSEDRPESLQP